MRIYITTADIQQLTGKTLRQSQGIMRSVKDSLHKERKHYVTFMEFCHDTMTPPEVLKARIPDAFIVIDKVDKAKNSTTK